MTNSVSMLYDIIGVTADDVELCLRHPQV